MNSPLFLQPSTVVSFWPTVLKLVCLSICGSLVALGFYYTATNAASANESSAKSQSEIYSGVNSSFVTKTWDGGGATNNWSEAANWSGDTVPLAADTVVFDTTSVKNVTVDFNITVAAFQIASGYSGVISKGTPSLTVNGVFTQTSGTFTPGS